MIRLYRRRELKSWAKEEHPKGVRPKRSKEHRSRQIPRRLVAALLMVALLVVTLPEGFVTPVETLADQTPTTYTWTRVHTVKELENKVKELKSKYSSGRVPILLCYRVGNVEYFVQAGEPSEYCSNNAETGDWNGITAAKADSTNGVRVTRERFMTTSNDIMPLWLEDLGRKCPTDQEDYSFGYCYTGGLNGEDDATKTLPTYHIYTTNTDTTSADYGHASSLRWCYYRVDGGHNGNTYMFDTGKDSGKGAARTDSNYTLEETARSAALMFSNTWFVNTGSNYDSANLPNDEFHFFMPLDGQTDLHLFYAYGAKEKTKEGCDKVKPVVYDARGRFREGYFKVFVGEVGNHMLDQEVNADLVTDEESFTWKKATSLDDFPTGDANKGKPVPILLTYTIGGVDYYLDADCESYSYGNQQYSRFFSGRRIYTKTGDENDPMDKYNDDIDLSKSEFTTTTRLKPLWIEYSGYNTKPHSKYFTNHCMPSKKSDRKLDCYRIYASDKNGAESSYRLYYYDIKNKNNSTTTLDSTYWAGTWDHGTAFLDYYDNEDYKWRNKWTNGGSEAWAIAQLGSAEKSYSSYYKTGKTQLSGDWQITNSRDKNMQSDKFMLFNPYEFRGNSSILMNYLGQYWHTDDATQVGFVEPEDGQDSGFSCRKEDWDQDCCYFTIYIGQFTNEQVGGTARGSRSEKKVDVPTYEPDEWWEFTKATDLTDFPMDNKEENGFVPIYMVFENGGKKYCAQGAVDRFHADGNTNKTSSGFYYVNITNDENFKQDSFVINGGNMIRPIWIQWAGTTTPHSAISYLYDRAMTEKLKNYPGMKEKLNEYYIYADGEMTYSTSFKVPIPTEGKVNTPSTLRWANPYYVDGKKYKDADSYLFEADESKNPKQSNASMYSSESYNSNVYGELYLNKWMITTGSTSHPNTARRKQFYFTANNYMGRPVSIVHPDRGLLESVPGYNNDQDKDHQKWMESLQFFDIYIGHRVQGQEELEKNEVIKEGEYVEYRGPRKIPAGGTLTIQKDATLVISGILQNEGLIRNEGGLVIVKEGGKIICTNDATVSTTCRIENGVLISPNGSYIGTGDHIATVEKTTSSNNTEQETAGQVGSVYERGGDLIINSGGNAYFPNGIYLSNAMVINYGGLIVANYTGQVYNGQFSTKGILTGVRKVGKVYVPEYTEWMPNDKYTKSEKAYLIYTKNSTLENHGFLAAGLVGNPIKLVNNMDWSGLAQSISSRFSAEDYKLGVVDVFRALSKDIDADGKALNTESDQNAFFNSGMVKVRGANLTFEEGQY